MFRKYLTWDYYTSILLGKRSYKTFLVLVVFALIFSIYYSYQLLKIGLPFASNAPKYVQNLIDKTIPGDLTIAINNGVVSTNVTEPYYVTMPKEYLETVSGIMNADPSTFSKIRLLTIDTKGRAEDFERYQSYALLTDNSLVYYNDENVTIQSLRDIEDFSFNKQMVLNAFEKVNENNQLGKFLFILLLISPFFIFVGILVGTAFTYLYLAFLTYIMARLYKTGATFMQSYRYTVAISIVLVFVWSLVLLVPSIFEYLYPLDNVHTIIVVGIAYLGIRQMAKHTL